MKDFFISYNSVDKSWAEWIAWQLESTGYQTVIQAWDFLPGENFVLGMHEAARETRSTILVLSPAFLNSKFAEAEWAAAFRQDPQSEARRVLPVRVAECKPDGLLGAIIYVDLVGLDAPSAKAKLLDGVKAERIKPTSAPAFPVDSRRAPAAAPDFPGAPRNALKGLRPFGYEDAALFQRLQRERELQACLTTITDRDFRIGILFGESGCGKTSFVQAGLWPMLPPFSPNHHPVYVKFSELDPLVTLRQAFKEQLPSPPPDIDSANFLQLCASASQTLGKTLVLFFDQFEQFFVHFPQEEQRRPFIAALAEWYRHAPAIKAKILLSLRHDYYAHHHELQQALGYSLGPQDSMPLRKFTPKQATEIFQVIAETTALTFDRGFVEEMTARELAGKDDGRISPVDIQILTWMISGQEEPGGLNRATFQKMGGVEGLLENYLNRALGALAAKAEQQAALKIMLALVDLENNVRAGVLTPEQIGEKLGPEVSAGERQRLIAWLAGGKVRLLTPVEREGVWGYELAHERLIQPLRRLTNKQLTEVDQANRLLERRVNEWLANTNDKRYLLSWKELRQINRQQAYLVWGKWEMQKRELLKQSRRRAQRRAGFGALAIMLLVALGLSWPMLEKMRTQRQQAAQRQQLAQLMQDTVLTAQVRVEQVNQFVKKYGDPRSEVTTLDSMQFCYVPPGPFYMGSDSSDTQADKSDRPLHLNEQLSYGYWISRFPVTVAQFRAFVLDSASATRSLNALEDPDNRPVRYVTWYDAVQFCKWLTRKWQRESLLPADWQILLPSEAEWEKAARGGVEIPAVSQIRSITTIQFNASPSITFQENPLPRRRYPWGDSFNANFANSEESNIGNTSAVGCFPYGKSPYGCEEMSGNVWQWTRSLWGDFAGKKFFRYLYDPHDGREVMDGADNFYRVLRGGAYYENDSGVRCAGRNRYLPDFWNVDYGFRLVVAPIKFLTL